MELGEPTIIVICLLFSAFFSGLEMAFISSDRLFIELKSKQGIISSKIVAKFVDNPNRFLATMLIGNNLALVTYGIYMAALLEPWIQTNLVAPFDNDIPALIIQTLISTAIVLVTAEFVPKSFFLINPDRLLHVFAYPANAIYWLMTPLSEAVNVSSRFLITRVLGLKYEESKTVLGLADLNNYIKKNLNTGSSDDTEAEIDTKIFDNALEFKTVKVRDCMIPRTEIIAIDIEGSIDELSESFITSGHSKVLVYKGSIDDIVGYCHSIELFKKPKSIEEILSRVMIVPETLLANELMIQFIAKRRSIAVVLDEYGGTSGIVTMEDIIEEIFGEIQDEHDVEDLIEEKVDPFSYILSARHEVEYLNDKYGWTLPEGDYETLGGLILEVNENIPNKGDVITIGDYMVTVLALENYRIDRVKFAIIPQLGINS